MGGNPNGLNLGISGGDFSEYMEEVKRMGVDVTCLYEINLDTNRPRVRKILYDNTNQIFDHARLCFTSSSIPSENEYKPGGTLMISQGKVKGRFMESGSDSMGRWCYQTFLCKENKQLTIVSAYQTCTQKVKVNNKVTTLTATAQQTSELRQQGRDETPRQAFVKDLKKFLETKTTADNGVLLLGDFNEALGVTLEGMTKLVSDLNLVDICFQEIGDDNFNTFLTGKERLDYGLGTSWVAEAVAALCYEPFKYRTKGDHRNIIIDFHTHILFGNKTSDLGSAATREFNSKDKAAVAQYIAARFKYLEDHHFERRIKQCRDHWNETLAESLDADFKRAAFHAANKCKKKPNLTFVRLISQLRCKKNILIRCITQDSTNVSMSDSIANLAKYGTTFLIPETIQECKVLLRQTQREIKQKEKHAATHRRNDLNSTKERLLAKGDKKGAKQVKQQIIAENTKEVFRKLRQFSGSSKGGGLTRLEVPKDPAERNYKTCKEWITITTPEEIEEHLRDNKRRHFGQADGTFPTVPPFSEWVDWGASTHTSELILEGNFTSEQLDVLQQELITHMKKRNDLDSIADIVTTGSWKGKIKSWPEGTSTSPSGFHLTHSKALISPHNLPEESIEAKILDQQQAKLVEWQVEMLNLAIENRYSYKRWQMIVNVMILKELSNYKIHRLRVIHIYEHDYNLILATKWRELIQKCTTNKTINDNQYGGVPGRDAIMPVVIEELQYEITRASKRPLVQNDYDAVSCYDRIIMSMASIVSRARGMHRNIVFVNASTLRQAKYHIKAKLKVSESFFQHGELFKIYGSGQGSGNSPGLWCIISSVLFDVYETKAHGATFYSPCLSVSVTIFLIGYVDDKGGSTNDFLLPTQAPTAHYIEKAAYDAQRWNDVLKLSGGELEETKQSYHVMYYDFTMSGLPILRGSVTPLLKIKFNNGTTPTALKYKSPFESHKILGVHKEPAGTQRGAWKALKSKNDKHAKILARNPFDRTDTWTYYHAVYLPSICYTFPSGFLTTSQCNELQSTVKQVVLPKYGFNRNSPDAVVYGPTEYAGIEIRTLSVEQGLSQLQSLMTCLRTDGVPNRLANIAISWAQLLAGTQIPIFESCKVPLPHLSPMKLIPAIRNFLATTSSTLELSNAYEVLPQRENDIFLMDAAQDLFVKPTLFQTINACRLYLGVTLLSDIATPTGNTLQQGIFDGVKPVIHLHKGLMPYQDRPSETSWAHWKKFLKTFLNDDQTLSAPLRRWYMTGKTTHRQWRYYGLPNSNTVFIRKEDEYECYDCSDTQNLHFKREIILSLPPKSVPVEIDMTSPNLRLLPWSIHYPSIPITVPTSFFDYLQTLQKWEQDLFQNLHFPNSVYEFSRQVTTNPQTHYTSDGSAPNFIGTFGWVSALPCGQRIARCSGPAYGYRTTSFRAEAYGMLSYLRLIIRACEYTNTSLPTHFRGFTDAKSVLDQTMKFLGFAFYYPNVTMCADWDLIQAIVSSIRQFPIPPTLAHVEGHQDRNRRVADIPLPAQLNVQADHLAGLFRYPDTQDPTIVPRIQGNSVQLHTPKGTISSKLKPAMRRIATEGPLISRIKQKNKWSQSTFDSIDWEAHGISVRNHYHRKHFTTKFIHNWLPLGALTSKYDSKYLSKCPSCDNENEDREHFLRCIPRKQWQSDLLADFQKNAPKMKTQPEILDILQEGLLAWFDEREPVFTVQSLKYRMLIHKQTLAGWDQLLYGRFVLEWRNIQDEHLATLNNTQQHHTGRAWVTKTTELIWHQLYVMWEVRNGTLHGIDQSSIEVARLEKAKRETEALYSVKDSVLPRDSELFYRSLSEHYEQETTSRGLRQWLRTWKPTILKSVKDATRLSTRGMTSIRNHFLRLNNDDVPPIPIEPEPPPLIPTGTEPPPSP